jgi:hypothetical protein
MRARTAATTGALAAAAALLLAACGGGSDGSDPISTHRTAPATSPPTASAPVTPAGGRPLTVDPSLALPADLKLTFDWTLPADRTQAAVLTAGANYMQSLVHGVVRQSTAKSGLRTYAAGQAYTYATQYVQLHVDARKTLTGTDRYYRPVVEVAANKAAAQVTFCENQSKLYSKDVATRKIDVTGENNDSYLSYRLVLALFRPGTDLWQAQSVTVKERALQCEQ